MQSKSSSWFPDWRGAAVAIVASGPSTKKAGVGALRGRIKTIAIKENVELCPWADVVYGCDAAWWRNANGLPKYSGLKVAYQDALTAGYPDIRIIDIDRHSNAILTDEPGRLGSGGNSGFQALNLAVQFGVTRVLLVGFDMQRSGNLLHWYGHNNGPGRNNPGDDNFKRWRAALDGAAGTLADLGVEVADASESASVAYRKVSIEGALAEWGL